MAKATLQRKHLIWGLWFQRAGAHNHHGRRELGIRQQAGTGAVAECLYLIHKDKAERA